MSGKLNDKVAVITGGTRGLGLAIASAYAQEGAKLIIASRSQKSVDVAIEALRGSNAQADGLAVDVSQVKNIRALADHAIKTFGKFDIWVNNAALSAAYGPTASLAIEEFEQVLHTNIFGVYYGSVIALRHFLTRGTGKLINILGNGDRKPVPLQNAYASSKIWVRNFTLALASEYKDSGIDIFAYNPGLMETDLMSDLRAVEGYEQRLKPLESVMRMWANPPGVPAQKAVWLASSDSDGKNGMELKELSIPFMLSGVLKEGWRRLTGKDAEPREMHITSVHSQSPSRN